VVPAFWWTEMVKREWQMYGVIEIRMYSSIQIVRYHKCHFITRSSTLTVVGGSSISHLRIAAALSENTFPFLRVSFILISTLLSRRAPTDGPQHSFSVCEACCYHAFSLNVDAVQPHRTFLVVSSYLTFVIRIRHGRLGPV